eukprot:s3075_g5.t1
MTQDKDDKHRRVYEKSASSCKSGQFNQAKQVPREIVARSHFCHAQEKAAEKLRPFSTATKIDDDETLLVQRGSQQSSYLLQFRFKFSGVVAANASVPKLRMK